MFNENINWTTFNGKKVKLTEIDHQHLSNIYWYGLICCEVKRRFVLEELKNRFNGQLLPYRPHINFDLEIKFLEQKGYLRWVISQSDLEKKGIIRFEGEIVGEVKIPKF